MTRFIRALCVFVLSLPLAASGQDRAVAPGSTGGFTLGPGDVLRVTIWREIELSGEFGVNEINQLTLPMLGVLQVGGIQWRVLRDSLLSLYTTQLKTTSIILSPLRRVYVFGEVLKPGPYMLDPTLSFAGAVALAGGANSIGDMRRIRVVRQGLTLLASVPVESLFVGTALRSDDQIYIGRRSWFDINSAFLASAALSLTGIVISLVRR